jgi:hypothetical protein
MTMTSKQTHYESLGVARDATTDDIKKAFRKLARENHPDRLSHLAESAPQRVAAEEKMRHLTQAYDVLIDANKRRSYDRGLNTELPPRYTHSTPNDHGGFAFDFDFANFVREQEAEATSRQRAWEESERLKNVLNANRLNTAIKKTFFYRLVITILYTARPLSLVLKAMFLTTLVTQLFDGVGIGEFLFGTASQPEVFSAAPVLTALGFGIIGVVARIVCVFYRAVLTSMYESLALSSIITLTRVAKRTTVGTFFTTGLACGFMVGRLFF